MQAPFHSYTTFQQDYILDLHDELTDKQSLKRHSFAYSNASYKMRSGMEWIKQISNMCSKL